MVEVARSASKRLYKITIECLKIIPALLALCALLNTVIGYYNISNVALSFIGGTSLLPLLFLYLASYVFRFCIYHRMFLHYVLASQLVNIYDMLIGIPVSDLAYFELHLILAGIFLFLVLFFYYKVRCCRQ